MRTVLYSISHWGCFEVAEECSCKGKGMVRGRDGWEGCDECGHTFKRIAPRVPELSYHQRELLLFPNRHPKYYDPMLMDYNPTYLPENTMYGNEYGNN